MANELNTLATLRIGELVEKYIQVSPEVKENAIALQAALLLEAEVNPDKNARINVRPLAQVLEALGDNADKHGAAIARIGNETLPNNVPTFGMVLTNPNAGLVEGGAAVSKETVNHLLTMQAAARIELIRQGADVNFQKPRLFGDESDVLKRVQEILIKVMDEKAAGSVPKLTDQEIADVNTAFLNASQSVKPGNGTVSPATLGFKGP